MDEAIAQLVEDLKHPDAAVRDQATHALWERWFWQKGAAGLAQLQRSQVLIDTGEILKAQQLLDQLIEQLPDFAEAWNRRAVLHYTQENYRQALQDCEAVIRLVPFHFGALHGVGLCYAALGEYRAAARAFRQALEVQPYALINQQMMLECLALL
ncbi:MAG TPA: tetratricopeptide repeat protein [Stenomitos sp.]